MFYFIVDVFIMNLESNLVMKKIIILFSVFTFSLFSCDLPNEAINEKDVLLDSLTNTYVFKDSIEMKVTGTIVSNFVHMGQRVTKKIIVENGLVEGNSIGYYENGVIAGKRNYKNGLLDGIMLEYDFNGIQIKETIYDMGKEVKSYDFDKDGNKLIPIAELLDLLGYKTGFYQSVNYNSNQISYQPIVIMKWENISDKPLEEHIEMTGVFISEGEEWSNESVYFQRYDVPLQPNIVRQIFIKSKTGYTDEYGVGIGNVSCQISIDGKVFKTFKIANRVLQSNRM